MVIIFCAFLASSNGGDVTLGTDSQLTGSTVTFSNNISGTQALTIEGNAVLNGGVGAEFEAPLSSLHITGATELGAWKVSTTGKQKYDGAVTLTNSDNFLSPVSVAEFNSTVNASQRVTANGTGNPLSIIGDAVFSGTVGGIIPVAGLSVARGTTTLGADVITDGYQIYGNINLVGGDRHLTAYTTDSAQASNCYVTFNDNVNGPHALDIKSNATLFYGDVGATTPLKSVSVSGQTILTGNVMITIGRQIYDGDVFAIRDNSLIGSSVEFGGKINTSDTSTNIQFGPPDPEASLDLQTDLSSSIGITGDAVFSGTVGGSDVSTIYFAELVMLLNLGNPVPLKSLSVSGSSILGGGITTSLNQAYNAISLSADTALSSQAFPGVSNTITYTGFPKLNNHMLIINGVQYYPALGPTVPPAPVRVFRVTLVRDPLEENEIESATSQSQETTKKVGIKG